MRVFIHRDCVFAGPTITYIYGIDDISLSLPHYAIANLTNSAFVLAKEEQLRKRYPIAYSR